MERFIVSKDPTIYEAWPDVVLAEDGTMICVFSECTHHGNRDLARLTLVTSKDRGRTWSTKRYLSTQGTKMAYYNCARISRHSDGTLYIVCDYIVGGNENRGNTHEHLWKSTDNGTTWEGPIITPVTGIVPDRLLELESGRWILAAHAPNKETNKLEQSMRYSDDKGKTWSQQIMIASDPRYNLCEASILPVGKDLVCFMRENSAMGWDCQKAISHDDGETWEGVYNVPLPGCHRPTSGFLRDGRVLVTYRFLQGGTGFFGGYQNVFGALMKPESALEPERRKQSTRIFPLAYDRSTRADTGYTGWVQFDDGEVYVVNYIMDDADKAWISGISFRPEELVL